MQKKEVIGRMSSTEENVTGPTNQNEMTAKEVGRMATELLEDMKYLFWES